MAFIRTATSSPPTDTTLTVLVDGLQYPSTEYYQITLYCQNENGSPVGTRNMLGLPNAGGNSTDGFRTGTATFSGLDPGTTYRFYALAKYYSYSTEVRIPSSSYEYFSTTEPSLPTGEPWIEIVSVTGKNILGRVHTGDYTGDVDIDYSWATGTANQNVSVGSNDSSTFQMTVPDYDTYYEVRGIANSPDNSQSVTGSWTGFYSGQNVGTITGLTVIDSASDYIEISWDSAAYASTYRVEHKLSTSSTWITSASATPNTWWTFTGLQPEKTYNIRVRGEDGDNYGAYTTINAQTLSNAPTTFDWTYAKVSGGVYNLTALEWTTLCSKINQWREYKLGPGNSYSFSPANSGAIFYASMFNQTIDAISPMGPTVSLPARRQSGEVVTAAALNGIRNSLNNIPK